MPTQIFEGFHYGIRVFSCGCSRLDYHCITQFTDTNDFTINTPKRIVTFEVAEVNELEVEDLEVGEDMNVQILQGDANAPTNIFLDDMEPL